MRQGGGETTQGREQEPGCERPGNLCPDAVDFILKAMEADAISTAF